MGILLDALPGFTWWGGFAVTGSIGVVSFLFKAALAAEKEKRVDMERRIQDQDKRMDEMKDQVHRLQLEILMKINEVGIKLESFRRDLSK